MLGAVLVAGFGSGAHPLSPSHPILHQHRRRAPCSSPRRRWPCKKQGWPRGSFVCLSSHAGASPSASCQPGAILRLFKRFSEPTSPHAPFSLCFWPPKTLPLLPHHHRQGFLSQKSHQTLAHASLPPAPARARAASPRKGEGAGVGMPGQPCLVTGLIFTASPPRTAMHKGGFLAGGPAPGLAAEQRAPSRPRGHGAEEAPRRTEVKNMTPRKSRARFEPKLSHHGPAKPRVPPAARPAPGTHRDPAGWR